MTKSRAVAMLALVACLGPGSAAAWWDDDDYHDRWYGGPWYGGYPYHGWGGYPGYYGWGHPGYGWGGYPGYGYGSRHPTIIVNPPQNERTAPEPERQLPK
ncbi:MAG: hypothetical protein PVI91_11190 [Gammaproteobacteria bacterium]